MDIVQGEKVTASTFGVKFPDQTMAEIKTIPSLEIAFLQAQALHDQQQIQVLVRQQAQITDLIIKLIRRVSDIEALIKPVAA